MGIRRKKTLIDQAAEFAESILPQIESAVDSAREKAGPALADARAKAAPLLAEGKALAAEKAASGRHAAGETLAAFAEHSHSEPADDEPTGKRRKGGKLKKLIVVGGLAAVAGVVAKKLLADSSGGNWQESYKPAPPPAPRATAADVVPPDLSAEAPVEAAPYDAPAADTSAYDETAPEPPEVTATYDNEVVAEPVAEVSEPSDDAAAASPGEALADATNGPHEVTTPDAPAEVIEIDSGEAPAADPFAVEQPAPAAPAATSTRRSRGLAGLELGEDAAAPLPDGSAPEGFEIKGNQDSGKYHTPASPWYGKTIAEVWFRTEEAAEKAGFVKAG